MAGTAMDRVLGVASICVGLLATIVLAVAVSVDYWLHTDEPIDTGMTDPPHSDQNDDTPASHVAMVTTNSGLFRVCVYAKADYTGKRYYLMQEKIIVYCDLMTTAAAAAAAAAAATTTTTIVVVVVVVAVVHKATSTASLDFHFLSSGLL